MTNATHSSPIRSCQKHWLALLLGVVMTWCVISHQAQASDKRNDPRIIPPQADFRGLRYGDWEAEWWRALLAIPVIEAYHPSISGGAFAVKSGVLFLSPAYYQNGVPPIDATVSAGTAIFVPVISFECSVLEPDPAHGDNEAQLRGCANSHIDMTSGLFAEIDGVPLNDLNHYRVQSPLFEYGPLPEDNVLEAVYGGTFEGQSFSVDAGVYLLLAPLSVGTHTIHVGGTYDEFQFSADTTFHITVEPPKP